MWSRSRTMDKRNSIVLAVTPHPPEEIRRDGRRRLHFEDGKLTRNASTGPGVTKVGLHEVRLEDNKFIFDLPPLLRTRRVDADGPHFEDVVSRIILLTPLSSGIGPSTTPSFLVEEPKYKDPILKTLCPDPYLLLFWYEMYGVGELQG